MENNTVVVGLEKVKYNYLDDLQENDYALCDDLVVAMQHQTYLCDAISEVADNWIEIYNAQLFSIGFSLYAGGYCEQSVDELGSKDIIAILQGAHYLYNQQVLYDNINNIVHNIAVDYINDNDLEITEEEFSDNLESELDEIDSSNSINDITYIIDEYIEERNKNKTLEIFENFDRDKFISNMCDGMLGKISECLEHTFDVKEDNIKDVLSNDYNIDEDDIIEYDLEDEYEEFCQNLVDDLYEQFEKSNSEYFIEEFKQRITIRNSPILLVDTLSSIENLNLTVDDMNNEVTGAIEEEYEVHAYYGGFRGEDAKTLIYQNKSVSYRLGNEIWLTVFWDIVEVNEEDYWKTIIKVTNIELT